MAAWSRCPPGLAGGSVGGGRPSIHLSVLGDAVALHQSFLEPLGARGWILPRPGCAMADPATYRAAVTLAGFGAPTLCRAPLAVEIAPPASSPTPRLGSAAAELRQRRMECDTGKTAAQVAGDTGAVLGTARGGWGMLLAGLHPWRQGLLPSP